MPGLNVQVSLLYVYYMLLKTTDSLQITDSRNYVPSSSSWVVQHKSAFQQNKNTHTFLKKKTFCDGEGAMQTFGSDSSYCASTCINSVIISWRVFKQIDHPLTFGDTQIMAFFTLLKTCFCRFQCFVYLLEFLTVRLTCNELPDPKLSTAKNTNNIQRIRQMR